MLLPSRVWLTKLEPSSTISLVGWSAPPIEWVKEGASKGNPEDAGCGGILRNEQGKYSGGFVYHIDSCSALEAELWGIFRGLQWVWNLGYRNVQIESDSKVAIEMIMKKKHNGAFKLVSRIQELHHRRWNISFLHCYREANRCADWLANSSLERDFGMYLLQDVPPQLAEALVHDDRGVSWPRLM